MSGRVAASSDPGKEIKTNVKDISPDDVFFYSWSGDRILYASPACYVPKPGIVLTVMRPVDFSGKWPSVDMKIPPVNVVARIMLESSEPRYSKIKNFISSPDAQAEPIRPQVYDVFLSYSTDDYQLASELRGRLEGKSLSVFLAGLSLHGGDLWSEEIRTAIRNTHSALLLLTPYSIKSQWVIAEAGALWAIGVDIVPAIRYVKTQDLPSFITNYQWRNIETDEGLDLCVEDIARICSR